MGVHLGCDEFTVPASVALTPLLCSRMVPVSRVELFLSLYFHIASHLVPRV
jgi:hypothetical protein